MAQSDAQLKAILKSKASYLIEGLNAEDRKRLNELAGIEDKTPEPESFVLPKIPNALKIPPKKKSLPPAEQLVETSPSRKSPTLDFVKATKGSLKRAAVLGVGAIPEAFKTSLKWGKSIGEFPGAFAISMLEGSRGMRQEEALEGAKKVLSTTLNIATRAPRLIVPGTAESNIAGNMVMAAVPFTPQSKATGEALFEVGKHEVKNILTFMGDPSRMAKEDPGKAASALLWMLPAGAVVNRGRKVIFGGRQVSLDALDRAASVVDNTLGEQAAKMMSTMEKAGVRMTFDEALESVIGADSAAQIFRVKRTLGMTPEKFAKAFEGAPPPRGQERRWFKAAGDRGLMGWHEMKMSTMRENYLSRMVGEQVEAFFGPELNADIHLRYRMSSVKRGVHMDDKGSLQFGGIARADVVRIPSGKVARAQFLQENQAGTFLRTKKTVGGQDVFVPDPHQRVVGPILDDNPNFIQLYKLIDEKTAKSEWKSLIADSPEAEDVLMRMMAADEIPRVTVGGDKLPTMSLPALQKEFKIQTKLTGEEAETAAALIKTAYGPGAIPANQNLTFNYVPESIAKYDGIMGRMRNRMAQVSASARRRKTGKAFVAELEGAQKFDLREGLTKTQRDLVLERSRNETASNLFSILAEPLTKEEIATITATGSLRTPGFVELSTSGLGFGNARKFNKWLQKNRPNMEEMGIPIPDKLTGEILKAGGKGHKIAEKVARDLGALFDVKTGISDPIVGELVRAADSAIGEILSIQISSNLTRFSTANRNLVSQVTSGVPKALVDLNSYFLQKIPALRWEEMPEAALLSDFTAARRIVTPGLTKKIRQQMPPEMMGQTFMEQWHQGPVSGKIGKILQHNGFQFWDVSAKRVFLEQGVNKGEIVAYHRRKRLGTLNPGESKKEFMRKYRAGIPETIRAVAMREADTYGAYDYSNIPRGIRWMKQTNIGRGIIPYPTYIWKNWANLMSGLGLTPNGALENLSIMMGGRGGRLGKNFFQRDPKIRKGDRVAAMARQMTGVQIAGALWWLLDDDGEITGDIKEESTRQLIEIAQQKTGVKVQEKDLFFEFQKTGRLKLPLPDEAKEMLGLMEDQALWVRSYDQPLLGEMQAYKAMMKGNVTFGDYLNDRVSTGSLVNGFKVLFDLNDKYNSHLSFGTKTGDYLSNFIPLHNELQLVRKLTDPVKRERSQADASFWKNMAMGLADQLPIMSAALETDSFLPPRHRTFDDSVARYPREQTTISYFLWNIRAIDEKERSAAISLAALELMGDRGADLNRKITKGLILKVADAETGKTEIGQARRIVAASEASINSRVEKTLAAALMKNAYLEAGGGPAGAAAATEAGQLAIVEALERGEKDMKSLLRSANTVLSTLMSGASEVEFEGFKFRGLEIRRLLEVRKTDRPAIMRELIRLRLQRRVGAEEQRAETALGGGP